MFSFSGDEIYWYCATLWISTFSKGIRMYFPSSEAPSISWMDCPAYQAISGAGKTFEIWPEMVDNVIPYIGGEDEKSENEPMKVWGRVENGVGLVFL